MKEKGLELLESLMTGHDMTIGELDTLVNEKVSEKLHLEYKHGNELKKADASKTIRQYVSGFANADGGVLIIGIDEKTWRITGCPKPKGLNLAQWAATCLTPIASNFSPPPRFCVVTHPKGEVLLVATYRSLTLVPCTEAGRQVYYFRFHDETLSAPDYLISDLVLGRRQHPFLRIGKVNLYSCSAGEVERNNRLLWFQVGFTVPNDGLLSAERVRLGIVSWVWSTQHGLPETLAASSSYGLLSGHLLSYVEVENVDEARYSREHSLVHLVESVNEIQPFTVASVIPNVVINIPVRILDRFCIPYTWEAAIYLMPRASPPVWYQLTLEVGPPLLEAIDKGNVQLDAGFVVINPCTGTRPRVAWSAK